MNKASALGLVSAGLLAGVVLAGLTTATAQSPTPTPSVGPDHRPGRMPGFERGPGHRGGPGHGMGVPGALHGEFTTKAPDGGYRTMAMQHGDVTAVSATSVTVKSEDGFSRTYVVNDDTLVNAGDEGIADVKTGDQVNVLAIVEGGTARAVHLNDGTNVRKLREQWMPRKPRPSASAAT